MRLYKKVVPPVFMMWMKKSRVFTEHGRQILQVLHLALRRKWSLSGFHLAGRTTRPPSHDRVDRNRGEKYERYLGGRGDSVFGRS